METLEDVSEKALQALIGRERGVLHARRREQKFLEIGEQGLAWRCISKRCDCARSPRSRGRHYR